MDSPFVDLLNEYEGGCFYNDEYLSEAYTNFLFMLLGASPQERQDPRALDFLESDTKPMSVNRPGMTHKPK